LPLRARRTILEDLAKEIGTLLPLRARTAILEDLAKEIGTFKHAGDIARRVEAEPFVLAGGRRLLSQARLLSLEFLPYSMRRMGGDISTMIVFLAEHFQEGSISPGGNVAAAAGTLDEQAIWQPIASIAAFLRDPPNTGSDDYLDVAVRKV